ncbi:serine-rich adhesin for platelets-like [Onthophagus taurus]|uniref:serine-rich adhesin for platelets-like n=1 Tax=Onthophagus taurus TaxID=166361 RepID=UPI0039BDB51A
MVKKGTYHVQDPEGGQPAVEDTSYKSFLCVLLIFISFCALIIVFSSFDWFKTKEKQPLDLNGDVEMVDKGKIMQGKELEANRTKDSDKEAEKVDQSSGESTTKPTKKEYAEESNEIEGLNPEVKTSSTTTLSPTSTTTTTLKPSTSTTTTSTSTTSSLIPQTTPSNTSTLSTTMSSTTTSNTTQSNLSPSSTTSSTTTSSLIPPTTTSSTTTSSLSTQTTTSSTTSSSLSPTTTSSTTTSTLTPTTTSSTTTSTLTPTTTSSTTTSTLSSTTTSTLSPTTTSSTTTSTLSPTSTSSTTTSTLSSTTTSTLSPTTTSSTTTSTLSPTSTSSTTTSTLSPPTISSTTTSTLSPPTTSSTTTSTLSPPTTSSTTTSTLSPPTTSSTTTSTLSPPTTSSTTTSTLSPPTTSSTTTSTLSPPTTSSTTTSTLSPPITSSTTTSTLSPPTTSSTTTSTLSPTSTSSTTTSTLSPPTTSSTTTSTLSPTSTSSTITSTLSPPTTSSTTTSTLSPPTTSSTTTSSLSLPTTSSTTTSTLSPPTTSSTTTSSLSPPTTSSTTTTTLSASTASSTTTSTLSPTTTTLSSSTTSSTSSTSPTSTSTISSTSDDYHTDVDSTVTLINKMSRSAVGIIVTDITNEAKTTTMLSTMKNNYDDFDSPQETSGEDYVDSSSKSASFTTSSTSSTTSATTPSTPSTLSISSTSSTTTSSTSGTSTTTTSPVKSAMTTKSSAPQQKASARLKNKFKISVSDMLATMDHTIDKCEDFYSYSCGRASKKSSESFRRQKTFRKILNEEILNTSKSVFVEKMTQFYDTCITHESVFDYNERLTEVREIIEKLINDDPEKHDFTVLVSKMILTNTLPIMDVDIDVDQNTKQYVFKLSPPYKTLTRNPLETSSALYNIDSNCAKNLQREQRFESHHLNLDQIYEDFANCVKHFDHYITSFNVTRRSIEYFNNMYNLEFNIENEILDYIKLVSTSSLRNSFISEKFEEQTVDDLNKKFYSIDWKLLFKIISGKKLDDSSVVMVYQKDVLYNIFNELNKLQIKGSYINFLAVYTNDLFHATVIPKSTDSIDDYCLDLTNYLFSDVSSYLYMKHLPQDKITKAQQLSEEIFKKLKSSFLQSVEVTEGIDDEEDKDLIEEKIKELSLHFMSNSDECISGLFLQTKYDSINLGSSYVSQLVEMRKYKNLQKYSSVGESFKDTDTFCHFIQPHDYKPKSFYFTSKISIPYEFLTSYNMDYYPGYFLMAKIGTQIAIEMGKHFNEIGIKTIGLNDPGILEVLHTEQDKKFMVIKEQNITITPPEIKYIQTDADNAGFRLALKCFNQLQTNNTVLPWINEDFTDEQVFLIAAAQEFCEERIISNENHFDFMLKMFEAKNNLPNLWRVNKMIINTREFQSIFKCSIGSAMATNDAVRKSFPFYEDDDD